jgi:hypothetical protein
MHLDKVDHDEDQVRAAPHDDLSFTKDFFMYHIDKFFSKELNVVLHPIDEEYDKYLYQQKKQQDDF